MTRTAPDFQCHHRTPAFEYGFGLHDLRKIEKAWKFLDTDCVAYGYVVDLIDGHCILHEAAATISCALAMVVFQRRCFQW